MNSQSRIETNCIIWLRNRSAVQSQNAVSDYFTSKQIQRLSVFNSHRIRVASVGSTLIPVLNQQIFIRTYNAKVNKFRTPTTCDDNGHTTVSSDLPNALPVDCHEY